MTRQELITQCHFHVGAADGCQLTNDHEHYAAHMSALLDLLIEELVGSAPVPSPPEASKWNPESALEEIAIAIKHRTISTTHRWYIVHYYKRITCVPSCINVPPEIILGEFTDRMVDRGFSTIQWNQIKTNVTKFYKELHK